MNIVKVLKLSIHEEKLTANLLNEPSKLPEGHDEATNIQLLPPARPRQNTSRADVETC